jgi:molybdopterin converting factor small subunit
MTVNIRVFARLREQMGRSSWNESVSEGTTASQLIDMLVHRESSIRPFARVLRVAINDEWAQGDRELQEGDDVALLIPVSGG